MQQYQEYYPFNLYALVSEYLRYKNIKHFIYSMILGSFLFTPNIHAQESRLSFKGQLTPYFGQSMKALISYSGTSYQVYSSKKQDSFSYLYHRLFNGFFIPNLNIIPITNDLFPAYVRQNPRGYSYLCRLELVVEEKLPVGLWVKLGEKNGVKGIVGSPANFRMKLVRF